MCGIFGYVGKENAAEVILEGLRRLEYRGYDSWGVAVLNSSKDKIGVSKMVGPIGDLDDLKNLPKSHIGIGHTRWATHGGVTEANAHPHYSSDESFVLAQNGIVENYQELKKELTKKGYKFVSETDTEVIVRLVEDKLKKTKDLRSALREAFLDLDGRNTIILLSNDGGHVIAVRNGSPLVIGIGKDEYFFASDALSFAQKTTKVVFVDDMQMVEYKSGEFHVYEVKNDKQIDFKINKLKHEDIVIDKGGYDHFMIKEIIEQKDAIKNAVQYSSEELKPFLDQIKKSDTVYPVGAGTASYEAGQVAYLLRNVAKIKAVELKSYEMSSYRELFTPKDLVIAFSQSGETADTIEALEFAKKGGAKIASIVNMMGSTITRMSDFPFYARSGPEVCVCSTKAFAAKVIWGMQVAYSLIGQDEEFRKNVYQLADALDIYLADDLFERIKTISQKLSKSKACFVLGKGQNYYIALESALKIKEISYLHAEGFAAGELKHGVIALIEEGVPVFVIISNDENKDAVLSAAAEVKARGAWTIGVGQVSNELFDDFVEVPDVDFVSCVANAIPFQLISYFTALGFGYDPDKPRNLAKSVTVR